MAKLLEALSSSAAPFDFEGWSRLVDSRWTLRPLSAAGSLTSYGGRFNIGQDVFEATPDPFPALYIAENYETAYREKFQMEVGEQVDGLKPDEMNLNTSFSCYRMSGHLERVVDVTDLKALYAVSRVLKTVRRPADLKSLAMKLKLGRNVSWLIRTPDELQTQLQVRNWRSWAVLFDLPAPSQLFGEWAMRAGVEGIKYRSTKSKTGFCLAVFPSNLGSNLSFVELTDPAAPEVRHTRLDIASAENLCGWNVLGSAHRPRYSVP